MTLAASLVAEIPGRGRTLHPVTSTRMEHMTDAPTATTDSPEAQLAYFHERRELAVTQPQGSLALVTTQLIDDEQSVWGVPGRWAPLPEGQSGIRVIAQAADGIRVDGESVDGEAVVRGKDDP